MSERIQRTAATMRETMLQRYSDGLHHKHNKCRLPYRLHWPSHPSRKAQLVDDWFDQPNEITQITGTIREKNIKKTRLRIVKHRIH